jgi:hypothetical protein
MTRRSYRIHACSRFDASVSDFRPGDVTASSSRSAHYSQYRIAGG